MRYEVRVSLSYPDKNGGLRCGENLMKLKEVNIQKKLSNMEAIISWYGDASHGLVSIIWLEFKVLWRQKDILNENLEESLLKLDLENNFIFQQDNDSKAKKTTAFFKSNKVKLLEWPSQSPDLNPIENLWAYLDGNVNKTNVTDKTSYYTALQKTWKEIDPEYLKKLVESISRWLETVLKAKGDHTKY